MTTATTFAPGSLVTARGRDWVVLAGDDPQLVMVRPLGGGEAEITGILPDIEQVTAARFAMPDPTVELGDASSAGLLRDALRLGFRSGAGPFRSAGRISVQPRPYQLVPLLMAMRLDPVRMLIADDVGVGKTIEAGLIARELLECGDATKLAVLCPPHLAEQWQSELRTWFHLDAQLVLASTAARLERNLIGHTSLFDAWNCFVVSIDFIKQPGRRDEFISSCPDLVIVDEAHQCASGEATKGTHQRHQLVAALAKNPDRHLILVTATPHSGKDETFRSLLSLLDDDFAGLPDNLAGAHNRQHRERLARHLVQRRRSDIAGYLQTDTSFPNRKDVRPEPTYTLSADYRQLFDDVVAYVRGTVTRATGADRQSHKHRMRWWSALGLLRTLASSPAAAAATMRNRAITAEGKTVAEVDEIGRRVVLDLDNAEQAVDVVPGAVTGDTIARELRRFAERADQLRGSPDRKLVGAVTIIRQLVRDGFRPVVFCRFIETAEYLAGELRRRLRRPHTEVVVTTGLLPAAERQERIDSLSDHERTVLVTTDCLSEGINLQQHCTAVVHYDLPWNPTRLEQREGRVDRFGQEAPEVRVVTYWGEDNYIDESVLEVLLRKHKAIRGALGVSIPVPGATSTVIDALTENVLLAAEQPAQARFDWITDTVTPQTQQLELQWEEARQAEQKRRSLFTQPRIDADTVAAELAATQEAVGSDRDVERFVTRTLEAYGAVAYPPDQSGTASLDISEVVPAVRELLPDHDTLKVRYTPPSAANIPVWTRTHPTVAAVAGHVLDCALDPLVDGHERIAARCGVTRTRQIQSPTTLLVCRARMTISTRYQQTRRDIVAEEAILAAFTGTPNEPMWLAEADIEPLLDADPSANVAAFAARDFITEVVDARTVWQPHIDSLAHRRAEQLAEAHTRVRASDRRRAGGIRHGLTRGTGRVHVQPHPPTDILGVYIYLPPIR